MVELKLPRLSEEMTEGAVLNWRKKPGERFSKGEAICEIEVDKAIQIIEADSDCVLVSICVDEGEIVAVGTIIAILQPVG